jgi:lipopolysaccharide transport system ATP-binding protein
VVGSIVASRLGKSYRRYRAVRPSTFQEIAAGGVRGLRAPERFWALREVSFEIQPGHMVGVLGPNGAGKSTLLRLIGGVGRPDEGSLRVRGKVGGLLDLGAGFHPDLTGRENIFINGVISGLRRREVEERLEAIVDFAELEAFIDSPLRTYSTGMQARLGFSIAAHITPDVLLVDESLAVGDASFQEKCLERIDQFRGDGCTILLVSHDAGMIAASCDEALWLRGGRLVSFGPAAVVADQYLGERKSETERRTPREWPVLRTPAGTELRINENRIGSMEMEISAVRLQNLGGQTVREIESGDPLDLEIEFSCPDPGLQPVFGVVISREDGKPVFDANTQGKTLSMHEGKGRASLSFERLDLSGDTYYFDIGVYKPDWSYAYDYHWHAYPLIVHAARETQSALNPPIEWKT